jgi:5'-nucleotidase
MKLPKKQILLSNDDGIDSPGLWAAAEAVSKLGYVTVAAPRDHMSATGRGFQKDSDGTITKKQFTIHGQDWDVFAIGGSPSQSVAHGILEIAPSRPDLVVSGINFGENFASDVTYSGTVGAAIEAASLGIPGLSMSQEINYEEWDRYLESIDFSTAAYFTRYFARFILDNSLPGDVHVLNVVIPEGATPDTPWMVTPLANMRYFMPYIEREGGFENSGRIRSRRPDISKVPPGNDVHTVRVEKKVAVTPLSINLTARVDLSDFEKLIRSKQ